MLGLAPLVLLVRRHAAPRFLTTARFLGLLQTGQLSIDTLPANYRTTADQLSYVEMAWP